MAVIAKAEVTISDIIDGIDGNGITSTVVTYQAGTSGTNHPNGTWSTTIPYVSPGQYLWSRTVITYTEGNPSTTYSVSFIPKNGTDGATGSQGPTGTGIDSITQQYYLSTSKTTQTGGSWVTSMPTWSSGKYLWTRYLITYKNPTSTAYTSPVCDSSWEAVNEIEIGGRNLQKNSNFAKQFSNWLHHDKWVIDNTSMCENVISAKWSASSLTENITGNLYSEMNTILAKPGMPYTVSAFFFTENNSAIDGEPPSIGIYFYDKSGTEIIKSSSISIELEDNIWKKSVHTEIAPPNACYVAIVITGYRNGVFNVAKPKLELGNKATDWTLAPEDIDSDIKDAQDSANSAGIKADNAMNNANEVRSSLEILQSSIETLVIDQNGNSLMTQTGSGWTFNMGTYQTIIDKVTGDIIDVKGDVDEVSNLANNASQLANDIAQKTAYINMSTDETGAPCIELGKLDNEFKLRITNTSIDFMQGPQKIAYITNQSLYIQSSVVTDEMQIGDGTGFLWKKRSNGNMGLRYVG